MISHNTTTVEYGLSGTNMTLNINCVHIQQMTHNTHTYNIIVTLWRHKLAIHKISIANILQIPQDPKSDSYSFVQRFNFRIPQTVQSSNGPATTFFPLFWTSPREPASRNHRSASNLHRSIRNIQVFIRCVLKSWPPYLYEWKSCRLHP